MSGGGRRPPDYGAVLAALLRGPRAAPARGAAGAKSVAAAAAVVNPYRDEVPGLDRSGAARWRLRNLEAYLALVGRPRWLLVGEALGYRGGRFSGIAFTSERQLAGGAGHRLPWAASPPFAATSRNPALWLEPSGTVVWRALGGRPRGVLLWNAFPWHPAGRAGPLSNRRPESGLVTANLHVLELLLEALGPVRLLAAGRTAAAALARLGAADAACTLRHPAHGGATLFRRQIAAALRPPARNGMTGVQATDDGTTGDLATGAEAAGGGGAGGVATARLYR
jgi:hypothetical protein